MLFNYFKIGLRNFGRHKSFAFINILGLAIGMACSILIFLWVRDELSYDNFHPRNIFRITTRVDNSDEAVTSFPMAGILRAQIPDITNATRVSPTSAIFSVDREQYEEKHVLYADSTFLQLFSFPLKEGDRQTSLSRPDGVVITQDIAKKYFGDGEAMGRTITIDNDIKQYALVVTGVLKDIPSNSHLKFDLLLPLELYTKNIDFKDSLDDFNLYTYLQLNDHFVSTPDNIRKLESQIDTIYSSQRTTRNAQFFLQSIRDIHLHSRLQGDVDGNSNIQYVNIFSVIAIFILVIACVNFINLSTALSGYRAKEVGIRKVLGTMRPTLILQFICESLLLSVMALIVAVLIAWALLPFFNNLSNKALTLNFFDPRFAVILIVVTLIPGVIAGIYPALVLSGFKPLKVLKGTAIQKNKSSWLRSGLVVFQFAISIILIISAIFVNQQLHFIFNRDIGFDKENLIDVKMPPIGDLFSNTQALESTLKLFPGISDYTIVSELPANLTRERPDIDWGGKDPDLKILVPNMMVDENFVKTFKIGMRTGRFFSNNFGGDDSNFVVNETALKLMGLKPADAIGKHLYFARNNGEIIGVVKDFNFKPVHQPIEPLILRRNKYGGYLVVRVRPYDLQNTIAQLKQVFNKVYPTYPFSYSFLDDQLAKLYHTEQQMGKLLNAFSLLSIFISCMGLFGLAAFTAQSRTKEIGIRKVIGATTTDIVTMLVKDFLRPVVIATLISFPVSYWFMSEWLQNFAYHVGISWWVFLFTGLLSMGIALATISYQAIKAALANSMTSLRSE